jgi:hypothetical protein
MSDARNNNNTPTEAAMTLTSQFQTLTFGIEIETTGRTRARVARAIASVVGGCVERAHDYYDTHEVRAVDGRVWKTMSDSSISGNSYGLDAEVVSPVLRYSDLETLQQVVRAIRKCGARVDTSCGIHIHIGADAFTTKALNNLMKIVYKQENILYRALDIENRQGWAAKIGTRTDAAASLMDKINGRKVRTLEELRAAWYGFANYRPSHYDESRYHGVNLHNVFFRGTVEFRWFAATLHAGKIKAYIQLVLALACKAINARSASGKARRDLDPATAKYDWRVFLLSLGMKGDEFKTARLHLLAKLDGDSGFKNGRTQRAAVVARTAAEQAADDAAVAEHIATMSNN